MSNPTIDYFGQSLTIAPDGTTYEEVRSNLRANINTIVVLEPNDGTRYKLLIAGWGADGYTVSRVSGGWSLSHIDGTVVCGFNQPIFPDEVDGMCLGNKHTRNVIVTFLSHLFSSHV